MGDFNKIMFPGSAGMTIRGSERTPQDGVVLLLIDGVVLLLIDVWLTTKARILHQEG